MRNSVESTSEFHYDEEDRLSKISMEDGTLIHQYDEEGRLALSYLLNGSRRIRMEYEYEGETLTRKVKRYEGYYEDPWYVTYTYRYDADGKLLAAEVTSTKSDYDYNKEEYVSIYGDIYYYDELPEDAEPSEPPFADVPKTLEENTAAKIIGEWKVYPEEEEIQVTNLIFNEDGTCIVDGEHPTFEPKGKSDTALSVYILRDQIPVAYFSSSLNYDNVNNAYFYQIQEDGTEMTYSPDYYRVEDYNIYEITKENFFDYFELQETISVERDTFDDLSSMYVTRRYQLKEEFGAVNTYLSNVAMEYTYEQARQACMFDADTGEYRLGAIIEQDNYTDTRMLELGNMYVDDHTYYGFSYGYLSMEEFPKDEVYPKENIEINRLKGTIYTIVE